MGTRDKDALQKDDCEPTVRLSASEEIILDHTQVVYVTPDGTTEEPDMINCSPTHPENNDNKNGNNASGPPTGHEADEQHRDVESSDDEGNLMLLNDYRVSKMRKEEVIEFNFSCATGKSSNAIVKRNSSKQSPDGPVIQNLRQMYRKPARVPTAESVSVSNIPVNYYNSNNNVSRIENTSDENTMKISVVFC